MSKGLTALLLEQRLNEKFKGNKGQMSKFLINCIRFHGYIKEDTEIIEKKNEHTESMCKLCNSSNFIFNNFEKTCKECGLVTEMREINPFKSFKVDFNFNKGTIIPPGEVFVKITKGEKQFTVDLSKINTWLNTDPEERKFFENLNLINKYLDSIESKYNTIELSKIFEDARKIVLTMWYNVINNKTDMNGFEKKSVMAWCIFYIFNYYKLNINIPTLAKLLDLTTGTIYSFKYIPDEIFKNSAFLKYIPNQKMGNNIEMPKRIEDKLKIVLRDLRTKLSDPPSETELCGIIDFLAKELKEKSITLQYLSEKSGSSNISILKISQEVKKFYSDNPLLKKNIN
jgi:ribosomal protein L37E